MNNINKQQLVELYKALSDPTRIEMVGFLLAEGSQVSCSRIMARFELAQPTLSHHCAKLVKAGILVCTKRGTAKYYAINDAVVGEGRVVSRDVFLHLE